MRAWPGRVPDHKYHGPLYRVFSLSQLMLSHVTGAKRAFKQTEIEKAWGSESSTPRAKIHASRRLTLVRELWRDDQRGGPDKQTFASQVPRPNLFTFCKDLPRRLANLHHHTKPGERCSSRNVCKTEQRLHEPTLLWKLCVWPWLTTLSASLIKSNEE